MRNHGRIVARALPALLALSSLAVAGPVLGQGSCKGNASEYVIPAEQQDASLLAYDLNGDGVICVAVRGHKTVYSDNRS